MSYSDFLDDFFSGLTQCVRWLKGQIFADGNPFLSENLIFTIFAISIFLLLIEEILGLITDFHFGGFIIRRFGRSYGSGYGVKYETEYPKSYDVDYSSDFKSKPFRAGYRMKYFIYYDGRYYPFRHSRYNPFYFTEFNRAYRDGRIVSANQLKNGNYSSFNNSYNSHNSNSHSSSVSGSFGGIGRAYGKLLKKAIGMGKKALNGEYDPPSPDTSDEDNLLEQESSSPDASFTFVPNLPESKKPSSGGHNLDITISDEEWEEWENYKYDDD